MARRTVDPKKPPRMTAKERAAHEAMTEPEIEAAAAAEESGTASVSLATWRMKSDAFAVSVSDFFFELAKRLAVVGAARYVAARTDRMELWLVYTFLSLLLGLWLCGKIMPVMDRALGVPRHATTGRQVLHALVSLLLGMAVILALSQLFGGLAANV